MGSIFIAVNSSSFIIMLAGLRLAESIMKRSGVHTSVCLSHRHTHRDSPGAACDAAGIHLGWTIRRTDILVNVTARFNNDDV